MKVVMDITIFMSLFNNKILEVFITTSNEEFLNSVYSIKTSTINKVYYKNFRFCSLIKYICIKSPKNTLKRVRLNYLFLICCKILYILPTDIQKSGFFLFRQLKKPLF